MSFLAYMLRVPQSLSVYKHILAETVVRLLKDCPNEAVGIRRVRSKLSCEPAPC